MILHARARQPEGPDQHNLSIRFSNDPEWTFLVRKEQIDGTLSLVTDGDVVFVLRKNPRAELHECPTIHAEHAGDGIWIVKAMASEFGATTTYQLDHLDNGRRTTHAYGTVTKESGL